MAVAVYTIIETVDVDIISVRNFVNQEALANDTFDKIVEENFTNEIHCDNWGVNNPISLQRFAGDDAYSVELHYKEA